MAARTIVHCGLCPTVITTTPERSMVGRGDSSTAEAVDSR